MSKFFTISPSPHVKGEESVQKIMLWVILAMLPAMIWSFVVFGASAIITTTVAVSSCVLFEYLISRFIIKAESTINDLSALLTGILLAFNVPASLPIWMVIIGALVSIGIGKMSFGGIGSNPFNPALVGRVFLLISFPVEMTSWPTNIQNIDATSGATPLALVKEAVGKGTSISQLTDTLPSNMDLFFGNISGSMGEISALLLIIGALFMLYKKVITWHIPVSVLGTIFVYAGILWLVDSNTYIDPTFHLLTGGAMLGALYMATDMVTSPMTPRGQWIYGIGIGIITVSIRVFGSYPEGISFAILIMNGVTPLLNKYCKPKDFGRRTK